MISLNSSSSEINYGSEALNKIVTRLKTTKEAKKRYEYVLWLAKKLPPIPEDMQDQKIKVQGCISQVYIIGSLVNGKINWKGDSDALITKGLLALLILGLDNLTPKEILEIDPIFIKATGLNSSLTPSRANGFMNILLSMKSQAKRMKMKTI